MRQLILAVILLLVYTANAQKKLVSNTSYESWTSISNDGALTNDGKYALYTIKNKPTGSSTLVVIATDRSWQKEYTTLSNPGFSEDSRYLFAMQNDQLMRLKLGSDEVFTIPHCKGYELVDLEHGDWLCYQSDSLSALVVQNLQTNDRISLPNVTGYTINSVAGTIFFKTNENDKEILAVLNVKTRKTKTIYKGNVSSDLIFDRSGKRVAFTTAEDEKKQIWYYDNSLSFAKLLVDDRSQGIKKDHHIATDAIWNFSADGLDLFFTQASKDQDNYVYENPKIWNYQDAYLLSNYESNFRGKASILKGRNLTILHIKERKINQLLSGAQKLRNPIFTSQNTDVLLVESLFGLASEQLWNPSAKPSYYLCFTKTGELQELKNDNKFSFDHSSFSPDNKFFLYFDPTLENYVSFNTQTRQTDTASRTIKGDLKEYMVIDRGTERSSAAGIMGWIAGTHRVIIQGSFDLWDLDLDNTTYPVNITKGKGVAARTIFSLLIGQNNVLRVNGNYWIQGFDLNTKSLELYQLNLLNRIFKQVFRSEKAFDWAYARGSSFFSSSKASDAHLLILGTGTESPNYYYTSDFRKITPLSDEHPEKQYNWMTSELIKYKDRSGNECAGVLYKPANFDPEKKYPVIFYYYHEMGNELNRFKYPWLSDIGFNLPILVSQGYIVCQPDIYRIEGKPGEAALISVSAAADHLSIFSWIDSSKMAIIGHSLGGFETNYIVTHSDKFRAAISLAAPSSMIDIYNEIFVHGGSSIQNYVAKSALVMGAGLTKIPQAYIDNSPILDAENIKTPLLLMHNKGDEHVIVGHSEKLFILLRSLQKPVWLVQYEKEKHTLGDTSNKIDFQNKVLAFFDVFLKNRPMPQWMKNYIQSPLE